MIMSCITVVNAGFTDGGVNPKGGGANLLFWPFPHPYPIPSPIEIDKILADRGPSLAPPWIRQCKIMIRCLNVSLKRGTQGLRKSLLKLFVPSQIIH